MPTHVNSFTTESSVTSTKYYRYPSKDTRNSAEITDDDLKFTDGSRISTTGMGTVCAMQVG